jgi:hypothetical protein
MTYGMKPLGCDPIRIEGMSEHSYQMDYGDDGVRS